MSALVGLAELARFVAHLSRDEAREAARMLGYAPTELDTRPQVEAPPPAEPTPQERFEAAVAAIASSGANRPAASFWRVERYEPLPDAEELPTFSSTLTDPLLPEERGGRLFDTPEPPSLTPWRLLWPALHEALRTELPGRDPDTSALVRRWARGEPVARIPRVTRRAWAARASVWVDRSTRLIPLWRDQERVVSGLRRVMGSSLQVQRLDDESAVNARRSPRAWLARQQLDATTPVVMLGDLGVFGDEREGWRESIDALHRVGARVTAFVPWSVRHHPHRVSAAFHAVSWERGAAARRVDDTLVPRLLTLVAAASFVQPGMLRALRWLLDGADIETELSVWNHAAVEAHDVTGLVLEASEARALRAGFGALEEELQKRVSEVIATWHRGLPSELIYGETLAWTKIARVGAPSDVGAAREFARRLGGVMASESASDMRAWRHYGRAVMATMPPEVIAENPALAVVWDVAHEGLDDAVPPEGVDIAAVRAKRRKGRVARSWALCQVGDALVVSPWEDAPWLLDVTAPGSPIAVVTTVGRELLVAHGGARTQRVLGVGLELSLVAGSEFALTDARGTHHLATWQREGWMTRVERDRFGLWAETEVNGVRFRMRWIAPGRFVMGSPEGEDGRYEDEGPPHEIVLTRGYWLGETPVTQMLWEAVMGENPSRFKGTTRPVESVSWEDCERFLSSLNGLEGGAGYRLPTEAEWEYACRAGTTTATWLGDMKIVGANHAPLLDAIAWYGGNSGVGNDVNGAVDSSSWLEKQSPHRRAATHPVREKAANPWGLYDMLGNVWEWCSDWDGSYDTFAAVDPTGQTKGAHRVLRGGSWLSYAWFVRAAARNANRPSYREGDLGFRLLLGSKAPIAPRSTRRPQDLGGAANRRVGEGAASSLPDSRGTHHLATLKRGAWMTCVEEDRFGLCVETEVKGARFRMRWIPPGRFVMGSPVGEDGRHADEGPQHEVVLTRGYWLGETPVTQALWEAVMGENPSRFRGAMRPVEQVSWKDCERFLSALNGVEDGGEYRLPTEAEWEYACRAGTTTATWLGDMKIVGEHNAPLLSTIAWYGGNGGRFTHPVGEKAANPWGLYDMLGNVWEWCSDWFGSYHAMAAVDPTGPTTGTYRVPRGGSWNNSARFVRAATRDAIHPGDRNAALGFRLLRAQSALE